MFEFKIDGPALRNGVPIHIAVAALDNFQGVVDKSYLVSTDSKRISANDREVFTLLASNFQKGSLLTNFEIVLTGVQLSLPLVSSLGPQNLWELTKDSFNFLKLVCGAVQKGDKPTYEFNNDGDATVNIGGTHHHYYSQTIQTGQLALTNYQNLAGMIDKNKLNHISANPTNQETPDIYIGPDDKRMFDIPRRVEKETVELRCEIYDFNKYKNIGKLSVASSSQPVPEGEYPFEIFGLQDNVDYIYSMLKPQIELHCLIEMESNPFGEDKVYKLHVTGVNP